MTSPRLHVLVTGATGFVGRALVARLQRDGHRVSAWVRRPGAASSRLGADVHLVPMEDGDAALRAALAGVDAVVNLAGEPIAAGRWTRARKRALVSSRVDLTDRLVAALREAAPRPRVLVSASAVGYYGDRGDAPLTEASPPADGFLADLTRRWEASAEAAAEAGVRVVIPRIGVVLGPEGGALARLLPVFRAGLGGPLATGRQWMPWIHLRDLVEILVRAVEDERLRGPYAAVAPEPVTNATFTRVLARALGRSAPFRVPAPVLRAAMGEAAGILTASQRVVPERLLAADHAFRFESLGPALADLLAPAGEVRMGPPDPRPGDLPAGARPRHLLRQRTTVDAPIDEVFDFFSRAENLALLTPAWTDFRILGELPREVRAGTLISYRLRLGPVPVRWKTRIERWEPGRRFVDRQLRGPYRLWWHEHRFEADGERTHMEDRVYYTLPFGPLGRLVHRLVVGAVLRRIFAYRTHVITLRFGRGGAPAKRAA